jgi:hypothetical protein
MTQQEIYCNYLNDEGFPQNQIVDAENVVFRAEGGLYVIRKSTDCRERFALVFPEFWDFRDEAELHRALTVCNEVHLRVHGAMLFCDHNSVSAAVELFLANPEEDIKKIFYPSFKALQRAVLVFVMLMYQAESLNSPPSGGNGAVPPHSGNSTDTTGGYL